MNDCASYCGGEDDAEGEDGGGDGGDAEGVDVGGGVDGVDGDDIRPRRRNPCLLIGLHPTQLA